LLSAHTCHLNLHLLVTSSPVNECNDNFSAAVCARYFHSHSSNREISRCRRRITRDALARFESKLDNLYLLFTGSFVSCVHSCEYARRYFLMKYFRRTEIYHTLVNTRLGTHTNQSRDRHSTSATNIAWFVVIINIRTCFFHRFFGLVTPSVTSRT